MAVPQPGFDSSSSSPPRDSPAPARRAVQAALPTSLGVKPSTVVLYHCRGVAVQARKHNAHDAGVGDALSRGEPGARRHGQIGPASGNLERERQPSRELPDGVIQIPGGDQDTHLTGTRAECGRIVVLRPVGDSAEHDEILGAVMQAQPGHSRAPSSTNSRVGMPPRARREGRAAGAVFWSIPRCGRGSAASGERLPAPEATCTNPPVLWWAGPPPSALREKSRGARRTRTTGFRCTGGERPIARFSVSGSASAARDTRGTALPTRRRCPDRHGHGGGACEARAARTLPERRRPGRAGSGGAAAGPRAARRRLAEAPRAAPERAARDLPRVVSHGASPPAAAPLLRARRGDVVLRPDRDKSPPRSRARADASS